MHKGMVILPIPYRDPVAAFQPFAKDRYAALLDSAALGMGGRYSFMAVEPQHVITATRAGVMVDGVTVVGDPFAVLESEWIKSKTLAKEASTTTLAPVPFTGGCVGFLGYELGGVLEHLPAPKPDGLDLPLMAFGVYDTIVAFDHVDRRAWVISHAADGDKKTKNMADRLAAASGMALPLDWQTTVSWQADLTRAEVEKNIQTVIDSIHAGVLFQANYTQRFQAARAQGCDDFMAYRRLRELSPAPFAAFLRCGDVSIASASPERFVSLDTQRNIATYPIKGTRTRDDDPVHDARLADSLRTSAKDHAENLMIVDLMRNDLSRVAEVGSVEVPSLCMLESFASVHHLVSCVTGRMREGLDSVDLLRATFPGGSVTGAPKIKAMELIHALEPAPRGAYCGCLGWIGFDGAMDMSMTIRSLTLTPDTIVAQAGGGIVADSNPAAEYDESMIKIAPLLRAMSGESLDEIMD